MHQEECNSRQIHSATKIPNDNVNFLAFAVHITESFDTIMQSDFFFDKDMCASVCKDVVSVWIQLLIYY